MSPGLEDLLDRLPHRDPADDPRGAADCSDEVGVYGGTLSGAGSPPKVVNDVGGPSSDGYLAGHGVAFLGAFSGGVRTAPAVILRKTLAFSGAGLANVCADAAEFLGKPAAPAHPPRGRRADVGAVPQGFDAARALRHIRLLETGRRAVLARLFARLAGPDARLVLHVHDNDSPPRCSGYGARRPASEYHGHVRGASAKPWGRAAGASRRWKPSSPAAWVEAGLVRRRCPRRWLGSLSLSQRVDHLRRDRWSAW